MTGAFSDGISDEQFSAAVEERRRRNQIVIHYDLDDLVDLWNSWHDGDDQEMVRRGLSLWLLTNARDIEERFGYHLKTFYPSRDWLKALIYLAEKEQTGDTDNLADEDPGT